MGADMCRLQSRLHGIVDRSVRGGAPMLDFSSMLCCIWLPFVLRCWDRSYDLWEEGVMHVTCRWSSNGDGLSRCWWDNDSHWRGAPDWSGDSWLRSNGWHVGDRRLYITFGLSLGL
jgi:hypothetical protein